MRMMTALAVGSLVVLTGCATRQLSSRSLPPPRVVTTRTAPAATPATTRPVAVHERKTAATVPAPPSMELVRGQRPGAASMTDRVVPVSRPGRVQPAVAAPVVRSGAAAPAPAVPAVAPPAATRSRPAPASPCDTQGLFKPRTCAPIPVSACPGGT